MKDLRQANLPNRDEVPGLSPTKSPPTSPRKFDSYLPPSSPTRASSTPVQRHKTGGSMDRKITHTYTPILRPNMNVSSPNLNCLPDGDPEEEKDDAFPCTPNTNTGRGQNGLPRTVPLSTSPAKVISHSTASRASGRSLDLSAGNRYAATMSRASTTPTPSGRIIPPLIATATGTRYGVALNGGSGSSNPSPRQWGGGTPSCSSCGKSVYFAEQVCAVSSFLHSAKS